MNLDLPTDANDNNRMANRADPDETARNEPSHLDLHRLQRYIYWSAGMKMLDILLMIKCYKCYNIIIQYDIQISIMVRTKPSFFVGPLCFLHQ